MPSCSMQIYVVPQAATPSSFAILYVCEFRVSPPDMHSADIYAAALSFPLARSNAHSAFNVGHLALRPIRRGAFPLGSGSSEESA